MEVLKSYGFSDWWVGLISECITTVSYKALINGRTTKGFKPKCGLRQGDPLSPYLFLFCMDILSHMLLLGVNIGLFKGIKVCRRAPSINHLFFADDSMLFFRANEDSCINLMKIINDFGSISGQRLNERRSHVKFSIHTKEDQKRKLRNVLAVGEPTKVILIQSVLLSVASHVMRCLKVPASVTNKIDSLVTRLFWAGKGEKGMHWVGRGTVQRPKKEGGLGVRAAALLNDAMLFKQVKRLMSNPQLLATKVISSFDGQGNNILGSKEGNGVGVSWGRKGLYQAQGKFGGGMAWNIGRGTKVLDTSMAWVGGKVPENRSNQPIGPSSKWRVTEFIDRESSSWKPDLVRQRFVWKDAWSILVMEIPRGEVKDFRYWNYTKLGRFSVSSGYEFLFNKYAEDTGVLDDHDLLVLRLVWKMNILPKWKYFVWNFFYDGLAVKVNLARRGFNCETVCSYCGLREEDLQHVLRFCSVAHLSWMSSSLRIDPLENESWPLKEWVRSYILLYHSEDGWNGGRVQSFIALLLSLWKTRNARIFRGEGGHPGAVLTAMESYLQEVSTFTARNDELSIDGPKEPPGYNMVHIGREKEFHNDFVVQKPGKAGWGMTVSTNRSLAEEESAGQHGRAVSSDHAEAKACLLALTWASNRQINQLRINTDSAALVSYLCMERVSDMSIVGSGLIRRANYAVGHLDSLVCAQILTFVLQCA
ncbi:uncharacterized protein [Spinacia oleracea]|uniref:Reverse transcriptase domain-containing protein n=1 Tax=Spinacia oleracea TaxID=3562 RepID=A0ABM3RP29_SPIOL|nr:uncharacterized protein LOC130471342 [Spinacia oleracea]